jgi:anti-sigma regulatory factor (Ser/Thr protein kinase)
MGVAEDRPASGSGHQEESCAGLSERYPALPDSVPAARHAVLKVAAAAGASERQLEAIAVATSEAVTNAVVHAYPASAGRIEVDAWLAGGELWLIVADDGCGLRAGSQGSRLGVGLALISRMADGLSILDRSNGGTEIRMHFALSDRPDHPRGSVSSATRPLSPRFSTTR